ncbi:MAG: hypothetical protein HY721_14010 [Planctomycetes bacterium]|nr:hypothetical protein [Planctomycetota bacterium]
MKAERADRSAGQGIEEAGHAFRRRYLDAFAGAGAGGGKGAQAGKAPSGGEAAPGGKVAGGDRAATGGELAPFVLPWDDASPGPADVSFLLEAPAGKRGFVEARDGRFWAGDRRIRFWGVNVCFAACFPPKEAEHPGSPRASPSSGSTASGSTTWTRPLSRGVSSRTRGPRNSRRRPSIDSTPSSPNSRAAGSTRA